MDDQGRPIFGELTDRFYDAEHSRRLPMLGVLIIVLLGLLSSGFTAYWIMS